VRRHDLDVERVITPIDVVLDAHVRELDVAPIVAGKVVLPCPILDLQRSAIGSAIAVVTIAIALLQKLLIFALQVVFENDAVDVRALVPKALGFLRVGAIEFRVMLQFTRLRDAGMESLAFARVLVQAARFEQIASLFGQCDDAMVAVETDRLHQPGVAQMPEFTVTWVERLIEAVAEIAGWHGAECADGRQRSRFRAAEGVVVAVVMDVFSFESTRQVDVLHEHVARVHALPVAWV
jgi:hypothetical protein